MYDTPMMQCGHAANARAVTTGRPICATCIGIDPRAEKVLEEAPDLSKRQAQCGCGKTVPSSSNLAFFEYRGPGSRVATEICGKCGFTHEVHGKGGRACSKWVAHGPYEYDQYYCGCRGWN